MLHLPIRIQAEHTIAVVDQPHGGTYLQLTAARLVQDAALQTRPKHVQLGFAHGALESEQQSIVEVRRVVRTIFIANQCVGQRADLEQPVPVHRVARQTRDLQAEHDAGMPHADLGHEALEAFTVR